MRCPKCGSMDWMRGTKEEICRICLTESGQDVPLEVVAGQLPRAQSRKSTPKTYLSWKYARSKTEFIDGEVLLVATLSRDTPTDGSMSRSWQVDSVLVCYDNKGEDLVLQRHNGNYCEFEWNDVVWYIQLDDLQPTLNSLPVPSASAP
ncbi:hypothetical protein Pan110_54890 [Gimesia panareensis]|nr:hypothetical protein Pan110_54890 [Gimesia panareensis]